VGRVKGLDCIKVVSDIAFDDDLEHVSDAAFRTFIELIGVSAFDLTDGRVARGRAQKLCNTRYLAVALAELSQARLVWVEGEEIVIPNYRKYQKTREEVEEHRAKNRRAVSDYRAITRQNKNGSGGAITSTIKEGRKEISPSPSSPPPPDVDTTVSSPPTLVSTFSLIEKKEESFGQVDDFASDIHALWEYWKQVMNHPGAKFSNERKTKIRARLAQGYTRHELEDAIRGCAASPHHMGVNDTGTVYDSINLILRNAEKVDFFRALCPKQAKSPSRIFSPSEESRVSNAVVLCGEGKFAEAQNSVTEELWMEVRRRFYAT
jgi:hypothetical protein